MVDLPTAQQVIDGLADAACVLGEDGRILLVNPRWIEKPLCCPATGPEYVPGVVYVDALAERTKNDERTTQLAFLIRAACNGRRDGGYVELHDGESWTGVRVAALSSAPRTVLLTARDVTARARAEQALHHTQSRLRSVIAGAPIVLFSIDREGVFRLVEGVGASGLGATPELLLGRSVFEVYAHVPSLLEAVDGARRGETVTSTVPIGRMTFEIRCSPTYDAEGALVGVVGVASDVTERTRIEKMKAEFVSIVSHELRTPLTSIRGSLGLLEGGVAGTLEPKAHQLVTIARSNTERLVRLINDILDLDKMEAGRLEFQSEELSVGQLVDAGLHAVAGLAADRGVNLEPVVAGEITVQGDRDRLVQVLVNLLSNAIKHSPHDGRVVITAEALPSQRVRVGIADHGPGIPEDVQPHLFRKFQQVGEKSLGGSGLGLAISKAIVEAHHGSIDVESTPGEGATFFFDLPMANSPDAAPPQARAASYRGRTVELEVGGLPDPRTRSTAETLAEIERQTNEGRDEHDADKIADAHAQACILQATLPANTSPALRAEVHTLVTALEQLAVHGKTGPEEFDATIAALQSVRNQLAG